MAPQAPGGHLRLGSPAQGPGVNWSSRNQWGPGILENGFHLDFFLAISMIYIDLYIGNKHPNQPWLGVVDWVLKCPKNHFGGINQGLESCFCILRQETSKTSVHKKKR